MMPAERRIQLSRKRCGRNREKREMVDTVLYDSPLGQMLLAEQNGFLKGAWFAGQKYYPDTTAFREKGTPVLIQTCRWLDRYFAGQRPEVGELPLAPGGSEFRRQVWAILCRIPYGQTRTYGEIAREIGKMRGIDTMSAQAVGGAVGHNPISVIIPCHRVVGTDGSLTGYAGGLERKQWLLELEKP